METAGSEFSLTKLFTPFTDGKAIHLIIILGLLLFFNGLFNPFVGDDHPVIVNNPPIHSIANFPDFFLENRLQTEGRSAFGGFYYRPVLDTTLSLIYTGFGENPFFFHFFQLLFYITNACLVYFFFKDFFTPLLSCFLALLFLSHPINSEIAYYASNMQELLFFFFGMLALVLLQRLPSKSARDTKPDDESLLGWMVSTINKQRTIILANFLLLLSFFAKETGVLFLIVSLVYVFLFTRKHFLPFLTFSSLSLVCYFALRIHAIGITAHSLPVSPIERLSLAERLLNTPAIITFYLKTFFFPVPLSSSYQWIVTEVHLIHVLLPLIGVIFATLFFFLLKKKKQDKNPTYFAFFLFWVILGIGFHLQLLALDQTVAERWFYFPIIGVVGIIGIVWETIASKLKPSIALTLACILIMLLSYRSFVRGFDYRSDLLLATRDSVTAPESHNLQYIISHVYYESGDLAKAKFHAERSVELFPFVTNYTNLGAIHSRLEEYPEAKTAYEQALTYGDDSLPYENLASLSLVYGNYQENITFISDALKKYPTNGKLWLILAILHYTNGNKTEAKEAITQARLYNPQPNVAYIAAIIEQDKPLKVIVDHGNVSFSTL